MDTLELRMNYSAFIKLRDFVKINDISAEIKEYVKRNDIVVGKLDVNGNYLLDDLVETNNFSEEIPFNIIFSHDEFDIIDIDCVNLDYNVIDGRGIEVLFDILLKYEEYETRITSENNFDKELEKNIEEDIIEIPVLIEENKDFENIKECKENEIDELITEELSVVDDNIPTDVEEIEKRSTIKVCYYKENSDLDSVCLQNNIGIDKVFNDNKKTDFVKYRRVIIK